jgi:chromosome segregation protein
MQFTKLRLSGFKSFVEATEFTIEPGLTGIVGPNGCGKSNLVEALRWVMGENRVKQMRGGEMDDVIFAGTSSRPQRDVAEVALLLHNDKHLAPSTWNDLGEIEISRRIDRGAGSLYRIAGKDVRARDVQLFFADIASGSHSPALVSQGRIAAIIAAKPTERRQVLEEAAGITGLHARRHEAELKLRAAEQNLARLDDVIATLDQQLQALKKQAKQAERYRSLANLIRRAEAIVLTLQWREADARHIATRERERDAEREVNDATGRAAAASTELAEAAALLPALRKAEVEAAARVTRLETQSQALDAEEERLRRAITDIERQLIQLADDHHREEERRRDASETLARLDAERSTTDELLQAAEASLEDKSRELEAQRHVVDERESATHRSAEAIAAAEAERSATQRQLAELEARLAEVEREHGDAMTSAAAIAAAAIAPDHRESAATAVERAAQIVVDCDAAIATAEAARRAAQEEERGAREALRQAESAHMKIAAEIDALRRVLEDGTTLDLFAPVIDQIRVAAGYEAALGAALGDDLTAPLDSTAPASWQGAATDVGDPGLPAGVEPLATYVQAPLALGRRLAQIGVVDDTQGTALASRLATGQRLVTRGGALWRWDGYTVRAGATSAAATRLAQRNRLAELAAPGAATAEVMAGAQLRAARARDAERAEATIEGQARAQSREAVAALEAARAHASLTAREAAEHAALSAGIADRLARLERDRTILTSDLDSARARLAGIADTEEARISLADQRRILGEERAGLMSLQGEHAKLLQDIAIRRERLLAIAAESQAWQARADASASQIATLCARREQNLATQIELAAKPAVLAAERRRLLDLATAAEAERRDAADQLAAAESRATTADRRMKQEDAVLMEKREARIRAEAQREQAGFAIAELTQRIRERLDCEPTGTLAAGGVDADDALPTFDQVQARLERLTRERDNVGPVNLRAEQEAAEIDAQMSTLLAEKNDLLAAIAKLRQGIASLNREGRERLVAAFESVNKHFQELFAALFGGGKAHLDLSAPVPEEGQPINDDPLDAGLEVMASPPGKKLQTLSLLSGGEQALTALALLFAVFLTKPAPICVLDEVDAPLDDANVDRFCTLLDSITGKTDTRFVVVTHHRMTMARMDRLYGVTMAERGVSQLVSVDLTKAERMRATA